MSKPVKVAAAHPPLWHEISYKIEDEAAVLKLVDGHIERILELADEAADAGAIAVAYPEDTLGLLGWQSAHLDSQGSLLATAVERLLAAVSAKAKERSIYIIVCNDMPAGDVISNTAVLIGKDGNEIGRYRKVNQPFAERWKANGTSYPVFETEDLGTVGLTICYDMVFPEATRALALNGADIVFDLSMGGASMGRGKEAGRAAFITRAADNGLWVVAVWRGRSWFISPDGEIVSATKNKEALTYGEIDLGSQAHANLVERRARIFAERMPETYGILTDPNPPLLQKLKADELPPPEVYWRSSAKALTIGVERVDEVGQLAEAGKTEEARKGYEALIEEFRTSWVENVSRQRLEELGK